MFIQLLFYLTATILVVSSFLVIFTPNPIKATLFLILSFASAAVIWLLIQAEFLAILLLLVYVGAVMVLFLFVIMMLDLRQYDWRKEVYKQLPLGLGMIFMIAAQISLVIYSKEFSEIFNMTVAVKGDDYSNIAQLATVLFTEYIYQFELVAVLLLVAMIAAIVLVKRDIIDRKSQNINEQVAVKKEQRLRIIKD